MMIIKPIPIDKPIDIPIDIPIDKTIVIPIDIKIDIPIGVSYLYFMKNTGNITSTQNIEFKMRKS